MENKLWHEPGDVIKGVVKLNVQGKELTQFDGVTISLAGAEISIIDGHRVRGSMGQRVLHIKQNICTFYNGVVPEGDFEYPFELELPEHTDEDTHHSPSRSLRSNASGASLAETEVSATSVSSSSVQIVYKLRASLRRKKKMPRTVDNDIWCDAQLAEVETP